MATQIGKMPECIRQEGGRRYPEPGGSAKQILILLLNLRKLLFVQREGADVIFQTVARYVGQELPAGADGH